MSAGPAGTPPSDGAGPRLYREVHGDGPVVLLGHGFSGSARNFRPQARALRDRFRVILHDARGHARSEAPPPGGYAADALAGDLTRLLDEADAERAVVGGLSMGAAVALHFARAHPERVRGLVLASFPPGGPRAAARARAFTEALEREGLDAAGARFVWGPDSGLDARGAELVRQGFREHDPQGLAALLREFLAELPAAGTLAAPLAALELPTLLVAGGADAPSLAASRSLAAAGVEPGLEVVEGAGHVVNLVARERFDALLLRFLDGLPPAGPGPGGR